LNFQKEFNVPFYNSVLPAGFHTGMTDMHSFESGVVSDTMSDTDFSTHFTHLGVTYDVNDKISLTGNLSYMITSVETGIGIDGDNQIIIPGVGVRYRLNDAAAITFNYNYYDFSDTNLENNDSNANQIVTQLNMKF